MKVEIPEARTRWSNLGIRTGEGSFDTEIEHFGGVWFLGASGLDIFPRFSPLCTQQEEPAPALGLGTQSSLPLAPSSCSPAQAVGGLERSHKDSQIPMASLKTSGAWMEAAFFVGMPRSDRARGIHLDLNCPSPLWSHTVHKVPPILLVEASWIRVQDEEVWNKGA